MLQPGQIFAGRYSIRRLIGSGTMAEVYEARHVLTEHAVALKVLRPSSPGAGGRNFALEARIDARVGSPHIVHVQDAGVDESSGLPYLVLELLHGKTLAKLLREQPEGRLREGQTLEVLRQVALGLDAAHAYGVVHRNLQPENIFITDQQLVKILDFGLAKLLSASAQVTQQLRGTPYYMAVEQTNRKAVSAATDVWALGLVAYRCLTGRIYWRCANRRGRELASLGEVVCEITEPRRDAPSARMREDGLQLRLPEAFDGWLLRCLDVDPGRRFASAGEAVAALQRALGVSELEGQQGALELTCVSPQLAPAQRTAREESGGVASVSPSTSRPARALRKWGVLWVAAAVALLIASVFYPLRQAPAPAAAERELTEVAAQGLTPAPAERAGAGGATHSPASAQSVVPPAASPAPVPTPVAAAAAAPAALPAQQDAPKIAPIRSAASGAAPGARPAPPAKKRPRAAAARRARAAATKRARASAAAPRTTQEAGLERKIGLGSAPEAPPRPPPTALSD